ncbi:MAG: glycosyltransferase family 39 protein, partial [Chloroflexi bacterium]|nr:glycosyltransferase family 39 protein [Chloroflexota bacterium]
MAKFGHYLLLAAILTLAAYFRFQGLDWDQGYLFHPDERQILFVTTRLDLPANPLEFFSADSALNPKFFAYGSFPIYLLKALAIFAPATNFPIPWEDNRLVSYALLGRALSALFDLGTVALIFFLGRRLYTARVGLIAAASVAVTVLNIQLSHFYTVDTILTFFILATIYFAARYAETARPRDQIAMSVAFGLALATKISAVPLIAPIIFATIKANSLLNKEHPDLIVDKSISLRNSQFAIRNSLFAWRTRISNARAELRKIFFISLAVFFITQPYALLDPIRFIGQTGTEALIARGWLDVPFTRQYSDTLPYAYAIAQSSVWGMGLPLGLVAWIGAGFFLWRWWRAREWRDGFILAWALIYFFAIGGQSAKHLRYLLPLIPFFYLMAAHTISNFKFRIPNYFFRIAFVVALLAAFVYSLAFVGIYSREHPYSAISRWIYQNIPRGATIAIEHWDDQLPLSIRAAEA